MSEHVKKSPELNFRDSQRLLIASLNTAFRIQDLPQHHILPVFRDVYNAVYTFGEAFTKEHRELMHPLVIAARYNNRFHKFGGDLGGSTIQIARNKSHKQFAKPFQVFEDVPEDKDVIQWEGEEPYSPPLWQRVKHKFTHARVIRERHHALAKFYIDQAISPVGFTADNPQFIDLLVADYLFWRGRDRYFDYERMWWSSEMDKRGGSNKEGVTDSVYADRGPKRDGLTSLYQLPALSWGKLMEQSGNQFIKNIAKVASDDYQQMIENDKKREHATVVDPSSHEFQGTNAL